MCIMESAARKLSRDERVVRDDLRKMDVLPFYSLSLPGTRACKEWKMGLEETGRKVRQDAFSRAEADYFGKSETADLQGGGRVSAAREGKYGSVLLWPTMKMMWRYAYATVLIYGSSRAV